MYDLNKNESRNIKTALEKKDYGYLLTLTPDNEWLNSPDRAYPVVIDPVVSTELDRASIYDAHVTETLPTSNFKDSYMLKTGVGRHRTYVKFALPELSSGDMVTDAVFKAVLLSSNPDYRLIDAHKVLADWDEATITWNNKASYDETKIEDYQNVKDMDIPYTWNITGIVKDWYTTGKNYGLMLKNHDETVGYCEYYSSETNIAYQQFRPQVLISYVNNSGLESYWTYHSQSIGRGGTGYVNDYNGNLVYTHNDLSMNGNKMPLTINHVYNTNDRGKGWSFGAGWRINLFQELALVNISNTQYYMYTDEDGTRHYFVYDSKENIYKDESGLDLTLVKNADNTYTIKDKGGNLLYFTMSGYLYKIVDNNLNAINITYSGGRIRSITDGAGRVTTLDYNDTSTLLLGITDPSGRRTSFEYNGAQLVKINYPDGKSTSFTYDTNTKLLSAQNCDGYKITYSYTTGLPYRVNKIQETGKGGETGQSLNISYGYNSTSFKDNRNRANVYQFNFSGNTVSIRDEDGSAEYYKYFSDGGNKNKLEAESKLQKSILNYLKNHNAETATDWIGGNWTGSTGTNSFTTEDKYLGYQSLKVDKTNEISRHFYGQTLTLEKGKTYTFSGYVKTKDITNATGSGAALFVNYQDNSGAWQTVSSQYVSGTKDWQRYEIKFTVPSDSASNIVYIRAGIVEEKGVAYFDCLQVEDGPISNRYNIVENPSLSYGAGTPTFWIKNTFCDAGDTLVSESNPSNTLDGSSFKMTGVPSKSKNLYQTINISGNAGDIFSVGGWAKGNSVPLASGRYFALDVGFQKTDGSYEWHVIPFNEDSSDWQYVSDRIKTNSAYKSINIYVLYYNNANAVYFDNIQLYKEEFEDSYQYDAKGNLVSTTDLAKQNSTFEYNANNDLIKAVSPKGSQFTYSYDSKHNILSATSGENVVYSFTYDVYGNPITSKVGDSTLFLQSEAKYNSDGNNVTNGNYITELKDPSGNVVKYNYNQTKGNLDSLTDAKGKVTSYKYDSNLDRLESVSKTVDGNIITNSYTYENDRIKTINHNGFSYVFNYDSFGNVESVYVGTQKLVNNVYDPVTGNLTQVNYGNGQNISNEYDNLDRIKTEKYNGTSRYNYEYDGSGNLGYHEDLVNGINYRYIYDISDRLVKVIDSNGNTSSNGYDSNNNLEKFTEVVDGKSYITSYDHDNDNRIKKLVLPNNNNISYTYDTIGRIKTSAITIGTSQYVTIYDYDNGGRLNKVTLPGGKTIAYTHDANSNIETVNDGGKNIKYYYNELNELIREDNEVIAKTIVYSYDVGGNILSKTEYPYTTGTPGTATKTYTYTYGDTNWKDMLTAFDGKAITYDAIGNPLTYDGYTYTWEEGRQLKSIEKDGLNISFKYNSAGIRTEKNVNGVVTKYHLVGDKVTFESNGTDNIYYTYDSSDNLVSMNLNGVEYYYVRNGQGDITGLLDGNGNQVVAYTYDSWGKVAAVEGSLKDSVGVKNPYRYRGYRFDGETGLYYLNSRYYNPETCRMLNADGNDVLDTTLEDFTDKNLFTYCDSNPVNRSDEGGYFWETLFDIAGIGWSTYDLITKPSWANAGYLAWDIGATLLPFIPGSYTTKGLKLASKADDAVDATKAIKRTGRAGKQARLRC